MAYIYPRQRVTLTPGLFVCLFVCVCAAGFLKGRPHRATYKTCTVLDVRPCGDCQDTSLSVSHSGHSALKPDNSVIGGC